MNDGSASARIGPNAILQVMAALRAQHGDPATAALLRSAGLGRYLDTPPEHMVAEDEVIALHATVRRCFANAPARKVMVAAGLGTGDYLLAHRIPVFAQWLLRRLPARLASRALLAAIARHTWTFAGSGQCDFSHGHPVVISVGACPICRGDHSDAPLCDYYAKTFERLYTNLVHPRARVCETDCVASGAAICRFEIRWDD
jgi:divinyl protochlorophyllide a 8-vinyl-reductase